MHIAQDQAHAVGAVFHLGRGEEASLPEAVGLIAGRL